jgi:hypothetical protein
MTQQQLSSPKLYVLDKILIVIKFEILTNDAEQEQFDLTKTDPFLLKCVLYIEDLPSNTNLEEDPMRNNFNVSFIHYASKLSQYKCGNLQKILLEALIERGLNINYVDKCERTILDYAFKILESEEEKGYQNEDSHHSINEWIDALQACGAKKAEDISFIKSANKV